MEGWITWNNLCKTFSFWHIGNPLKGLRTSIIWWQKWILMLFTVKEKLKFILPLYQFLNTQESPAALVTKRNSYPVTLRVISGPVKWGCHHGGNGVEWISRDQLIKESSPYMAISDRFINSNLMFSIFHSCEKYQTKKLKINSNHVAVGLMFILK